MWNRDAQPLGGPSIDDQLQFGRHLHRQVARLLTPEDVIDVTCGVAVWIDRVIAIGDQATTDDETARPPANDSGPPAR